MENLDLELELMSDLKYWIQNYQRMTPDQQQVARNKSRNYIRFKLISGKHIPSNHPLLTPEERMFVEQLNTHTQAVTNLKIGLLRSFYDNCSSVKCTLKKKSKKVAVDLLEDILLK